MMLGFKRPVCLLYAGVYWTNAILLSKIMPFRMQKDTTPAGVMSFASNKLNRN